MKIHLYSWYNNFTQNQKPKYIQWTKEKAPITFYSDIYVKEDIRDCNTTVCALLIEPRSIQPDIYDYMEQHYRKFQWVFTHDSKLLKAIPNGKLIYWGGVYDTNNIGWTQKERDISFCSSRKRMCYEHIKRMELAQQLQSKIDCMGTYNGGPRVSTYDIYAPYRFSVVLENYKDDWWFSEKICNAFANKCVPIYWGATKIDELFDARGIIQCESLEEIPEAVDYVLKTGPEKLYNTLIEHVNINYDLVQRYTCFEDTFYRMYAELLKEMEASICG